MTGSWERALDECDARLDAVTAALAAGTRPAVETFAPPAVDGPIPAELGGRARECASRGEELRERLEGELEAIRAELRRLPRMPRPPREAHFDAQA
jgi:hypothetical protein